MSTTQMETTPTTSSPTTTATTQLPGIDNSQVIASQPYLIKENSSKPEHPENKGGKRLES